MKHRLIVLSSLVALVFLAGCNKPASVVGPSTGSGSGSWTQVNGLTGFYNIVSSGNNLYAADTSRVFLSTDGGSNWTALDTNLSGGFTIAAVNGDLFIGDFASQRGVFMSTDGGVTWVARDSGLGTAYAGQYQTINCIGTNGKTIFLGTKSNGIFRSTDNGESWSAANSGINYGTTVYSFAVAGSNIIVGTQSGTYLSSDDGATWIANDSGLVNSSPYFSSLNVVSLAVNGSTVYAGAWGTQVFMSQDNGMSWFDISSNLPGSVQSGIALAASDTSLVVVDDNGVFLSTNDGNNWSNIDGNLPNAGIYAFDEANGYVFVQLSDGSVWRRPI